MAFAIRFTTGALRELQALRTFEQRRITDAIRAQLTDWPDQQTRNRKPLAREAKANFEFTPPLWELRVGGFRVFYDVDRPAFAVTVRAVRQKPPGKMTEEVLNETDRD